jgi:cobalt-zinc-cadmium efflux system protein
MNSHADTVLKKRFVLSIALTLAILIAEIVGGIWTGSLALLSDAAHVFVDAFALGLSYFAIRLASRPADSRHTYGYHRMEVLSALINGALLGVIVVEILSEAWKRWNHPTEIKSGGMLAIAIVGLMVNLLVAFVLGGHRHEHGETVHSDTRNLNVHSAYLHVLGDAAASMGVILAAVIIRYTGWLWMDPLTSVFISVLIALGAWRVLRSSFHILMEGVPQDISLEDVASVIVSVPGVQEVHDLHVWSICPENVALSAHVVLEDKTMASSGEVMAGIKKLLRGKFGIEHTTIQMECQSCGQGRSFSAGMASLATAHGHRG